MSTKARRGFAAMDHDMQQQISSMGGKAAHAQGKAHEFTAEEARNAGAKGGKAVAKDREHMRRIGRLGGQARAKKRGARDSE